MTFRNLLNNYADDPYISYIPHLFLISCKQYNEYTIRNESSFSGRERFNRNTNDAIRLLKYSCMLITFWNYSEKVSPALRACMRGVGPYIAMQDVVHCRHMESHWAINALRH